MKSILLPLLVLFFGACGEVREVSQSENPPRRIDVEVINLSPPPKVRGKPLDLKMIAELRPEFTGSGEYLLVLQWGGVDLGYQGWVVRIQKDASEPFAQYFPAEAGNSVGGLPFYPKQKFDLMPGGMNTVELFLVESPFTSDHYNECLSTGRGEKCLHVKTIRVNLEYLTRPR